MPKKQIPLVFKPNCRNCYWEGHQTCDREDFTPCVMWEPKEKWFSKKIKEAKKTMNKDIKDA